MSKLKSQNQRIEMKKYIFNENIKFNKMQLNVVFFFNNYIIYLESV